MGQIMGYVVVLSLSLAVLLPVILFSQDKIIGNTQSVAEIAEQSNMRASQNLASTLIQTDSSSTQIHISNIGLVDVTVIAVLIDGISQQYTLQDQQHNTIDVIPPKQLAVLDIQGMGDVAQIISESGNLFEINI